MNEIILNINKKIYRLTNENNLNKYDRAVKDAGQGASSSQILAHYDKYAGFIQDEKGNEIKKGKFWEAEKIRLVKEKIRKERFRITMKYIVAATKYFLIPLMIAYFIYRFGWNR